MKRRRAARPRQLALQIPRVSSRSPTVPRGFSRALPDSWESLPEIQTAFLRIEEHPHRYGVGQSSRHGSYEDVDAELDPGLATFTTFVAAPTGLDWLMEAPRNPKQRFFGGTSPCGSAASEGSPDPGREARGGMISSIVETKVRSCC